jgi:cell division protein FtsB
VKRRLEALEQQNDALRRENQALKEKNDMLVLSQRYMTNVAYRLRHVD